MVSLRCRFVRVTKFSTAFSVESVAYSARAVYSVACKKETAERLPYARMGAEPRPMPALSKRFAPVRKMPPVDTSKPIRAGRFEIAVTSVLFSIRLNRTPWSITSSSTVSHIFSCIAATAELALPIGIEQAPLEWKVSPLYVPAVSPVVGWRSAAQVLGRQATEAHQMAPDFVGFAPLVPIWVTALHR